MSARVELSGQRFGRWAVHAYAGNQRWSCQCDCGLVADVDGRSLRANRSRGCVACHIAIDRPTETHGGRQSRLYNIWCGMKERCYRPTSGAYPRYGGRGIVICAEWLNDFAAFREWSEGNGYRHDLTIDRRDNDGNYSPANCRWATKAEQNRNYSRVHMVEIDGRMVPLIDLAEKAGLKPYTVRQRIFRFGWSIERALTTPAKKQPYTFTVEHANIDAPQSKGGA